MSDCAIPVTLAEITKGAMPPEQNPWYASGELESYLKRGGSPQNAIIAAGAALAQGNLLTGISGYNMGDLQLAGLQIETECRARHSEHETERSRHEREHEQEAASHDEHKHPKADAAATASEAMRKLLEGDEANNNAANSAAGNHGAHESQNARNLLSEAIAAIRDNLKAHLGGHEQAHELTHERAHEKEQVHQVELAQPAPQMETPKTPYIHFSEGMPLVGLDTAGLNMALLSGAKAMPAWMIPNTPSQAQGMSL